ncbi:hypothetical protein AVEN_227125-1, partial [Araneus ventricosus]
PDGAIAEKTVRISPTTVHKY